ncbi:putative transcription regulator PAB1642 [Aspergillus clavatus NRRL 1]|uniref:Transcription regulator PAB1642, putative n=1 Tax=Aspergillus clavatus (strain ATCC 1007 / CBS 513.65 / DSM 816 / NCTC 3887 / NRRL 1 / QM 1276 / 107) TaxID=344612 RepID=A1CKU3_ASPCL|nr:transcription regulator PAB1642, putative [Aspergillus clavatus NRRL 1]EAW09767.1 transcription regulator PAB1642, putative [Aspergillus clavatus NRRL 1]
MTTPLTTHLLNISTCPLSKATTHPFLQQAGRGQLSKPLLSQWLGQDRLYAQSYIRFIGLLLAKIRLPAHNPDSSQPHAATAAHRAVDVLIDALVNIRTELRFFESVADEYALDLTSLPVVTEEQEESGDPGADAGGACVRAQPGVEEAFFGPTRITQAYVDMFMSAGGAGVSVLEGMVVLWATEVCYLQAWRYAASFGAAGGAGAGTRPEDDADGGALRRRFIPNWTSAEFEAFVTRIGDVVDDLAAEVKGAEEREALLGRCVQWWRQVLWLEERFWPVVKMD